MLLPLTETSHRVKGKLPGNIDLIIRAFANQRGGYVHDTILEWFEEYQSTTVNLRLLGVDKVRHISHLSSDAGGSLTTRAVHHHGFRAYEVHAGDWLPKLLAREYPERDPVSPSRSSYATS